MDEDQTQMYTKRLVTLEPHPLFVQGESRMLFEYPDWYTNPSGPICKNPILCSPSYIGHAILYYPFVYLNYQINAVSNTEINYSHEDFNDPAYIIWRNSLDNDFLLLETLFGPIFSSLSVSIFFLVCRTFGYSEKISLILSFVFGFASLITGLVFTIIVTRSLTPEEFGTWGIIGTLVGYVIMMNPMVAYWSTREIARGTESGKTAVISSGVFSIVGILAFLVIAFFVSEPTGASSDVLFFAALMIPFSFLNRTLSSIALGSKPHVNSFGVIIFDVTKIPAALIFVYFMNLGTYGAILSLIVAYIPSIIILAIFLNL